MKQEEIREGIAQELAKIPKGYIGITDPLWHEKRLVSARVQAQAVMEYLHSQGVVIKVDTSNYINHTVTVTEGLNSATFPARLLGDAGYVAVKSLI